MKPVPFFTDTITVVPHTATRAELIGKPLELRHFADGRPLSLYQLENGDLRGAYTQDDGVVVFIEGPEYTPVPTGATVHKIVESSPTSVQVAATYIWEDGAMVVSHDDIRATHWSVYIRDAEGRATHHKDFPIKRQNPGNVGSAKTSALVCAANLSMEHQIFIERIV